MSDPVRLVALGRGSQARAEPPVRGEQVLAQAERGVLHASRLLQRFIPEHLDPLAQTGAIANTTLVIAIVSGILLLFWYSPSVYLAWDSVEAMRQSPLTAQLVRSLHRYSSDACLLFVLLHATQIIFARRFTGARWLAWVTGVALIGLLWVVGWMGYWLVWDQRAQLVAVGTAKLLDGLPIFADPLSRSFLTDKSVNSMLFFMMFFFHMLVPLLMGIALWLHVTRLSRPRYFTGRTMTLWVLGSLVVLSLLVPATSAPPARMTVVPGEMTMDAWYLWPLVLTERLTGGTLWALLLVGGGIVLGATRWMSTGRAPAAEVHHAKCNACTQCVDDCPYSAITMVPRTDGRPYPSVALVDPSKCVGCGICAGSCDSSAIGLPSLSTLATRRALDAFVEKESAAGNSPFLAFVCASSAGADVRIDSETGTSPELPGYRVMSVPCSGWVHALTIERAIKRGAGGVLVVGCGPGETTYREGEKWTEMRLSGQREPSLRPQHVDKARVLFLKLDRTRLTDLKKQAAAFRAGKDSQPPSSRSKAKASVAGAGVAAALSGLVLVGAELPRPTPAQLPSQLVVSFKHPGVAGENCRPVTEEEKASQPAHMRQDTICERGRASVRLRVVVDGEKRLEKSYAPHGLSGDGNSVAIETLELPPGSREISLFLGDTSDPNEWNHASVRTFDMLQGERRVALFDKMSGFTWHGGEPTDET